MSTQNARDTHFFLAGWNGHMESATATTHFQQAMKSAPTPTTPLAAEHTTRSDADTMARAETTARFLLGWKYGQMPASPDTLLRQSARVKAKWAWNAACKLLRFIDGSAPAEVQTATSEPMDPAATAAQAIEQAAVAVPAMQWRAIKDGMPAWTDDNSIRVIAITAEDDFSGAQVHDVAAADFHIRDPEGPTDPDSVGTEVTRACTHWAYRDEIWPRAALAATPPAQAQTLESAAEYQALRDVYEQARGVLRHDGVDQQRAIKYRDGLVEAIEAVKTIDGGYWEPAPQAQDVQRDAAIEELCQLGYKFDGGKMIPPDFAGELWAVVKAAPCACKYGTCETKNDRACRMTQEIAASAAQGEA